MVHGDLHLADVRAETNGTRRVNGSAVALVVSVAVSLVGCGSENPFDHAQIQGTVTYEDGTPIPGNSVHATFVPTLAPLDAKTYPKNGHAQLDSAGNFSIVTSYRHADGVVEGKHKVLVVSRNANGKPTDAVPKEYWSEHTTPLAIDTADSPFQLKVRKPASKSRRQASRKP